MSLQTVGAIVCLFLAQVAADTGVHFVMERHPDSYFCGHLQCVADFTKSDQSDFTCVGLTIYDITQVNSELKLASVSAFDTDLYVDTTKSSAMSCTGIISRLQANLTLKLRHDIDCLYGVYKCRLDLVTKSGHPEVLTEIVIPEYNHNYTRVAEVISHIDKLTGLFNIHTTLVSNQTTAINNLGVDVTNQLMNQTAEIDRLGNHAEHQITKLVDQTTEINKLGSQLDILTTGLMNHTAEINKLGSLLDRQTNKWMNQTEEISKQGSLLDNQTTKLTDQTAEINKLGSLLDHQTTKLMNQTEEVSKQGSRLGSQLDDLTAQLINQTTQLHNLSQRLDLETTKQKQQHDDVEKRLMALDLKLDTIQQLSMYIADMSQDQDTCIKGLSHRNGTKKITLWGNTAALCDTTTDGGGWIIIQRRSEGDEDFFKDWNEYKNGFGDLNTDFWIGNDVIHVLSQQGYNELRVEMINAGRRVYAHYFNFSVASEALIYQLTVGAFEGTAGDSLTYHNNMNFSTFDRDNDKDDRNCADVFKGGWWYNACHACNLNGLWGVQSTIGMAWYALTGWNSVSFSEMKIRRG